MSVSNHDTNKEWVEFIQFHEPPLKDGEYTVGVQQEVTINGVSSFNQTESKNLYVGGPRFTLKPTDVHSQFPPPHNTGDHSNVMPHIILKRSTLPWERMADSGDNELPWLWLLVYNDHDLVAKNVIKPSVMSASDVVNFIVPTVPEIKQKSNTTKKVSKAVPGKINLLKSPNEDIGERINVLKVNGTWAKNAGIVPDKSSLELLTSVRKNIQPNVESVEWAVCVSNRLAAPGVTSYAHLVSLEERFKDGAFDFEEGIDTDGNIPFVSLVSWSFSCPDDDCYKYSDRTIAKLNEQKVPQTIINNIEQLEKGRLYRGTALFKEQLSGVISQANQKAFLQLESAILKCLKIQTETFSGLLEELDRGQLKIADLSDGQTNEIANIYIGHGSVALPHLQRNGNKTLSWYRGPLINGSAWSQVATSQLPARSSDQLLRLESKLEMLDVSYAAAWELGRQLTLKNKDLSMRQYAWKRQHAWGLKQAELDIFYDHLPYDRSQQQEQADASHWEKLMGWYQSLNLLYHVPFNYLVPDEQMLPIESIRFFTIDNFWVDCLIDGAFSIGRVTGADYQRDVKLNEKIGPAKYPSITGFLLRSDVVSGWPALEVSGSNELLTSQNELPETTGNIPLIRKEKLAPNLMICLFNGQLKTLDLHLKPEALHFGFERPDDTHDYYYKFLKDLTAGSKLEETVPSTGSVIDSSTRVVDVGTLSSDIQSTLNIQSTNMTSAQFALEMIEGVPRIRFNCFDSD